MKVIRQPRTKELQSPLQTFSLRKKKVSVSMVNTRKTKETTEKEKVIEDILQHKEETEAKMERLTLDTKSH